MTVQRFKNNFISRAAFGAALMTIFVGAFVAVTMPSAPSSGAFAADASIPLAVSSPLLRALEERDPGALRSALGSASSAGSASSIAVSSFDVVPEGYTPGSIALPADFQGGLGRNSFDDSTVFCSVGAFQDNDLALVNLASGTSQIIADGPFGAIGGCVAISPTQIVLVDNSFGGASFPGETILLLDDNNPADGDFDDPGEITELLAPILTNPGSDFSGAQVRLVPAGNPSGIPSGSVMIQTADGGGMAELLVLADPLGVPAFLPAAGPYFTGFDFNGGFDFTAAGEIILGTTEATFFTGEIFGLVNTNSDEDIDGGESNAIRTGEFGIADLAIDAEDDVLVMANDFTFTGVVLTFPTPGDLLADSVTPAVFASVQAGFAGSLIVSSRTRQFEPFGGEGGATLLLGTFGTNNVLTLTPGALSSARAWEEYE